MSIYILQVALLARFKPNNASYCRQRNHGLRGTDPTGQLSYGEIVLRGQCLTGKIVPGATTDSETGLCADPTDNNGKDV
jgi:hypothetical protein